MSSCAHEWRDETVGGGHCPVCVLAAVLDERLPSEQHSVPELPHYAALRFLAEAERGMGEVWEAYDTNLGRLVALKVLRAESVGARTLQRFLDGARAAANLHHHDIVTVHEVGEHGGLLYFSMELMHGGTLADKLESFRADRRLAVEALATVADAVQFAHDHGVLHRDLKPANILLDDEGRPHVADFGLALHVDRVGVTLDGVVAGTPEYMAPEQAEGRTRDLTVATDVYGLGAILYHLLTGRPPFQGRDHQEVLERVKHEAPVNPRKLEPAIERDLAELCQRCLEKDPAHRYRSAGELASTLRQFLRGEPIGRVGALERSLRFCRRNPMGTAVTLMAIAFVLIMTPSALSLTREEEAQKRADLVADNRNSAQMFAYAVLGHLRSLSDVVVRAAAEEPLVRALEAGEGERLQDFCNAKLTQYEDPREGLKLGDNSPFDMWFLLDDQGRTLADSKFPLPIRATLGMPTDYWWRDYFRGAKALGERGVSSTYVSPAFKSENDGRYKFAISTPVYSRDRERKPLGVLVAAVATQANLGSLLLKDTRAVAVLVAPHGRERNDPQPNPPFLILRHPGYAEYGQAVPMDGEPFQRLTGQGRDPALALERWGLPRRDLASSEDYRDPAAARFPAYRGRWLAGFAPVGNTGFVVVVQTRESEALKPLKQFGAGLAKWIGIALSPGLVLLALAGLSTRFQLPKRAHFTRRARVSGKPPPRA